MIGCGSDWFGRRRAMIGGALGALVVIPLWVPAPSSALIVAGGFLMQFFVQGAWGVIPAHMNELSPAHLRGFLPGFAYQLGMLCAGVVPPLEAMIGEHFLRDLDGRLRRRCPDHRLRRHRPRPRGTRRQLPQAAGCVIAGTLQRPAGTLRRSTAAPWGVPPSTLREPALHPTASVPAPRASRDRPGPHRQMCPSASRESTTMSPALACLCLNHWFNQ